MRESRPGAPRPHRAETLRRVTGLADTTVAIALTFLVLPLLELAPEIAETFPTGMLAVDGPQESTTVFYLGTLAVGASLTASGAIYIVAHPRLLHEDASRPAVLAVAYRALGALAVFALGALVSVAANRVAERTAST